MVYESLCSCLHMQRRCWWDWSSQQCGLEQKLLVHTSPDACRGWMTGMSTMGAHQFCVNQRLSVQDNHLAASR